MKGVLGEDGHLRENGESSCEYGFVLPLTLLALDLVSHRPSLSGH